MDAQHKWGELDVYNLSTYDIPSILNELMLSRSDNMPAKRELIANLRESGSSKLPIIEATGQTQKLFRVMMIGQGLMI